MQVEMADLLTVLLEKRLLQSYLKQMVSGKGLHNCFHSSLKNGYIGIYTFNYKSFKRIWVSYFEKEHQPLRVVRM